MASERGGQGPDATYSMNGAETFGTSARCANRGTTARLFTTISMCRRRATLRQSVSTVSGSLRSAGTTSTAILHRDLVTGAQVRGQRLHLCLLPDHEDQVAPLVGAT